MDNPDIISLLNKIQERLARMEHKIDMLGNGAPVKAPEERPLPVQAQVPAPVQQQPAPVNQANAGKKKHRRERQMYHVVCADCKKECDVPFKPTGDRPVYCRECYARRKSAGIPVNIPVKSDDEPRVKDVTPPMPVISIDWRKDEQVPRQEPAAVKKPAGAKRTAESAKPKEKKAGTKAKPRVSQKKKK